MKRTALLMGLAFGISTAAQATELELQLDVQELPDQGQDLISGNVGVTGVGLRFTHPLTSKGNLRLMLGYDWTRIYGSNSSYDSVLDDWVWVDAQVGLHSLEAGARMSWMNDRVFQPYVALSAKAIGGRLTLSDDVSNWSYPDPSDPTGETLLYEGQPFHQLGGGAGVQGSVGFVVLFGGKRNRPVALAMLSGEPGPAPDVASSLPAPPPTPARDDAPAPPAVPATPANTALPPPAAPLSDVAPVSHLGSRPESGSTLQWGFNMELGYLAATHLYFPTAGQLNLGGLRFQTGLIVRF